jgi:hypothetical protein
MLFTHLTITLHSVAVFQPENKDMTLKQEISITLFEGGMNQQS